MNEILSVVGMLLAVYGMASLIRIIAARWLFPHYDALCVFPLSGDRTDAEYLIRAAEFSKVHGRIIILDCGLTTESALLTREVCRRMNTEYVMQKDWEKIAKTALHSPNRGG